MNLPNSSRSILVVDDDESLREVLEHCLQRAGHQVVSAFGRTRVMAWLKSRQFDLVITDMQMSNLDGAEVIKAVKSHQPHAAILAMSASGSYMKSEFCLVLDTTPGAGIPLMKPFHLVELLMAVDQALNLKAPEIATAPISPGRPAPVAR